MNGTVVKVAARVLYESIVLHNAAYDDDLERTWGEVREDYKILEELFKQWEEDYEQRK